MRTGRIKQGYGLIQKCIMKMDIDIYAKSVYCLLVSYAGADESCYPSLNTMCGDLKISKPKLIDCLKVLIKEQLIVADKRKTKSGDFQSNIYYPLMVMETNDNPTNDVVNDINHVVNQDNNGVVNGVNTKNNTSFKKNNITLPKGKDNVLFDDNCFSDYVIALNKSLGKKYRQGEQIKKLFTARIRDGYTCKDLLTALENAKKDQHHIDSNFNYLTPEFFTRTEKLEKYLNYQPKKVKQETNSIKM